MFRAGLSAASGHVNDRKIEFCVKFVRGSVRSRAKCDDDGLHAPSPDITANQLFATRNFTALSPQIDADDAHSHRVSTEETDEEDTRKLVHIESIHPSIRCWPSPSISSIAEF